MGGTCGKGDPCVMRTLVCNGVGSQWIMGDRDPGITGGGGFLHSVPMETPMC